MWVVFIESSRARMCPPMELEEALERFLNYYISEPVIHTKPYEGVMETLEGLKERGILLAVRLF
jgi:phosphoglycolate phosphatase-like HAD superfamily hydrolase